MSADGFPQWAMVPFPALVLAIAVLPIVTPRAWEKRSFQGLIVALCALPVIGLFLTSAKLHALGEATTSYLSFVLTLGALYTTSGGIHVSGDIEAKPATNVALLVAGAVLASIVGTTGASMLMIRPVLRTNRQRENRAHLVPFFILAVANAGGLLTPLGDPPLLVGYIGGVPFFWTVRLFPAWLLYVGSAAVGLYIADRRAYAREPEAALAKDKTQIEPIAIRGRRNVALMLAIVPAAMLPFGWREAAMLAIALGSLAVTPRAVHEANAFTFAPIIDVAIIFAGLFASLAPIEAALASAAPSLPVQKSWQLFWASGLLSSVLDNAPTYTAFAALAKGLSTTGTNLIAGVTPAKLAAVSVGSVVMGATTYIGNGPNLMIKAIAERDQFPTPGFFRYAAFAFAMMLPAHLVATLVFVLLDR
jgi:Na+/H+ antiporter NhaD/arsenite permease-like protein